MKVVKYYCKLCGDYDVELRLNHLIKTHNAKNDSRDGRYKPMFDVIFTEARS